MQIYLLRRYILKIFDMYDGPNLAGGGYNPAPHLDVSSPRWDEDDNGDGLGTGSYFRGGRRAYGVGRQAVMI